MTAEYDRYWHESHPLKVLPNIGAELKVAPKLGVLELTCSQTEASFQLKDPYGIVVQADNFPAFIRDLPQQTYQVITWHHNHQWTQNALAVVAGMTNSYRIESPYGTVVPRNHPSWRDRHHP